MKIAIQQSVHKGFLRVFTDTSFINLVSAVTSALALLQIF